MNLHTLKTAIGSKHRRMRVGRGMSSGNGKTCGRGHKGQMSRKGHKHKHGFEGGQMRLIRRIPKRGFNVPERRDFIPVNIGDLSRFDAGTEVTASLLKSVGLASGGIGRIKILGGGKLEKKLIIKACAFSATAKAKIEAVGGVCEVVTN